MRRMIVVALAAVLVGSIAGSAIADDDGPEAEDTTSHATTSEVQQWKARMIADYFVPGVEAPDDEEAREAEVDLLAEEVLAVRVGEPVGWGALYKLMQLSTANGMSLSEYLATIDGDGGWAFGKRFKGLDDDQRQVLEDADVPRNLGQANKQAKAEERALKRALKNGS
jgi:hypothetical protein